MAVAVPAARVDRAAAAVEAAVADRPVEAVGRPADPAAADNLRWSS